MNEEVHIPISIKETTQDNSASSISEQDKSDKETAKNVNVLQADKSQQELKDIGKDTRPGIIRFFTKSKEKDSLKATLVKTEEENVSLKAEIINLKISLAKVEAERDSQKENNSQVFMSRISQLENSLKAKDEEILKISGDVRRIVENTDNMRAYQNKRTDMTIRARFTEISKLASNRVYSQPTELAGINWSIFVYKEDDSLSCFLQGNKGNAVNWPCSATMEFQLIASGSMFKFGHGNHVFTEGMGWGYHNFISFKDLFDESKRYVKDDSIFIAVVLKVYPTV